jgi:hypothetical protein
MHLLRTIPIALSFLLLLPACRPPEDIDAPPAAEGEYEDEGKRHKDKKDRAREGGDEGDESRLSRNGLGKEDFALVEAELACVRDHYKDDAVLKPRAEAAVYQRYGASEQWVERVRVHLKSEGKYRGKIEDSVAVRKNQVCPGGVVGDDMLEALDTLLRAEGGEGLLPITDEAGGDKAEGDKAEGDKAEGDKADATKTEAAKADAKTDAPKTKTEGAE